ncbi:MAG: TnpV protein, partial [Bilifractor sp.]
QMEWVARMNNIRHRADEIVLNELIYAWNTDLYEKMTDRLAFAPVCLSFLFLFLSKKLLVLLPQQRLQIHNRNRVQISERKVLPAVCFQVALCQGGLSHSALFP